MIPDTVVVLAKSPQPWQVKTRLQPTFSAHEAAALASAAIRDTLDVVLEVGARRTVVAWDGPRVPWLPKGICVVPQRGSSLDERLENAFQDVLGDLCDAPTLLVGMDTPQLRTESLDVDWAGHDALLGPSCDGGFWSIGFRRYIPGSIRGTPMSTSRTGTEQLRRLRRLGLDVGLLATMQDVDEAQDASDVAALAPSTRFGRLHRRLVQSPCSPTTLFEAALAGADVEVRVEMTSHVTSGAHDVGGNVAAVGTAAHTAHGEGVVAPLLDVSAWQRLSEADEVLLSRCERPVLDLGCGPGRFVEALSRRGLPALGIDLSRNAVERTRQRGAHALVRDVHDRLPAEGRWGTVLLADGNIGIGGDPLALLRRCRELLRPGAAVLVEASVDATADRRTAITLHGPFGRHSHPVPWAVVGTQAVVRLAAAAGLLAVEDWRVSGRAFVLLRHAG